MVSLPQATLRTTTIDRPSPRPARAAWRRWTPNVIWWSGGVDFLLSQRDGNSACFVGEHQERNWKSAEWAISQSKIRNLKLDPHPYRQLVQFKISTFGF